MITQLKTYSVTQRVASLINAGVEPNEILCITFTKKAAEEMKERVAKAVPTVAPNQLQVFTFHGFSNAWLRARGHLIGYPKYSIMSTDECSKVINDIVRTHSIYNPGNSKDATYADQLAAETKKAKEKAGVVSKVLNKLESSPGIKFQDAVQEATKTSNVNTIEFSDRCVKDYASYKSSRNKLDFSNLQPLCIKLLKQDPSIASQYKYVMVDEAQDINGTNLDLIKALAVHGNVMAVGDPNQSIYGFRGSSVTAVQDFIKEFNATELFLTYNFRSHKNIVEFANASIKRKEAKMIPNEKNNGILFFKEFNTSVEEVAAVINKVKLLKGSK